MNCTLVTTPTRITSARKNWPDICIILHNVHMFWGIISLSPHNHCYVEFYYLHITGEEHEGRWPVQGHIPSKLHSQNSNPRIQVQCSLDSTTDYCLYVDLSWKWEFFQLPFGFSFLLPLISGEANDNALMSVFMDNDPHGPASFLTTHRNRVYTAAIS